MRVLVGAALIATTALWGPSPSSAQPTGQLAPSAATCASRAAVQLRPGSNVRRAVDRAPTGATICFAAGVYRLREPIRPRRGQSLIGDHATLSGARLLRRFSRSGRMWVTSDLHANGQRNGVCSPVASRACTFPNDVLRDGVPLRRVLHRQSLRPRTYYVNYRRDRIVLPDDPAGHRLEIEVALAAIQSRAAAAGGDVTVQGFTVEDVASPAQHGAIDTTAPGWVIAHNTVQVNHAAGITSGGQVRIVHNKVVRNGQEGIAGVGKSTLVAHNVVAFNNTGHFDSGWEAGGCKWAVTDGLMVRDNVVHDNDGPGLWTDIDSQHTTYEGNHVYRNAGAGIFHEISGSALIRNNTVTNNGHGKPEWLWGSGILLAASHNVRVVGNTLRHNAEGIGLVQQARGDSSIDGSPRRLHDIAIRDNTVHLDGGTAGLVEDDGDESVFTDATITWTGNHWYGVPGKPFEWNDREISASAWRKLGHDTTGSFH